LWCLGATRFMKPSSEDDLRIKLSRYVSYLLRHNPEDLEMDEKGFVELEQLLFKVKRRFPEADRNLLTEIVNKSERQRFEIVGSKIRALYGHTIDVHVALKEDRKIALLFHGTTPEAAKEILRKGLEPMKRQWVHLSPTEEIARDVGKRRTPSPMILVIDAVQARNNGAVFYRATDKVYVCKRVPARFIQMLVP